MHEVRMLAVDLMRMEELLLDTLVLVQTCWNVLKFDDEGPWNPYWFQPSQVTRGDNSDRDQHLGRNTCLDEEGTGGVSSWSSSGGQVENWLSRQTVTDKETDGMWCGGHKEHRGTNQLSLQ